MARGRRALARPGLEPAERLRARRALPLSGVAGHRARPDRRGQGPCPPLRRSSASWSTSAISTPPASPTSPAWLPRRSSPRTAPATRCAPPAATSPTSSCARSPRSERPCRHRLRRPVRPRGRPRRSRHAAVGDRRPRRHAVDRRRHRSRRAGLGLRRRHDARATRRRRGPPPAAGRAARRRLQRSRGRAHRVGQLAARARSGVCANRPACGRGPTSAGRGRTPPSRSAAARADRCPRPRHHRRRRRRRRRRARRAPATPPRTRSRCRR